MNELALFAGAGGGILGGTLLGWRTRCAVELDAYARSVLLARQADGCLPRFPIWDDVSTFDGLPWRGHIDVISGGFPCQDISAAGKGAGISGARSGLWGEMARIIGEVRPRYVFVENSPLLVSRGLATVLGDLAEMGLDARWCVLGAHHVGAPHKRDRIWILAHSMRYGRDPDTRRKFVSNGERNSETHEAGRQELKQGLGGAGQDVANSGRTRCRDLTGAPGDTGQGGASEVAHAGQHGRVTWWESDPAEEPGGRELDRGGEQSDVADADGVNRGTGTGRQDGAEAGDGGEQQGDVADAPELQRNVRGHNTGSSSEGRGEVPKSGDKDSPDGTQCGWRPTEPQLGLLAHELANRLDLHGPATAGKVRRVAKGIPNRVARLKAIGNGQVPACAALAWRVLGGPVVT